MHGPEERKQIKQMLRHFIKRAVMVKGFQQGFGVRAQDIEFKKKAGVKHDISFFLIGEDVLIFAAPDAGPLFQCPFDRQGAEKIIPDDPAKQACFGCGDAVGCVDVKQEQGADVNFEDGVFGDVESK